jgi:3-hydroxy-3-methylglutaryl CoA synthase
MSLGILAYGAYIPRRRLSRKSIAASVAWIDAALRGLARGERAIAGWDEDPITMAVEAARDALGDLNRSDIEAIRFASTSFPFVDRLNSGVVATALDLREDLAASDLGGSQRAATSGLIDALGGGRTALVVAAEMRRTKSASPLEMTTGDAGAALLVGDGEPVARLLGSHSKTIDFVDHYRTPESEFDYRWEDRWVREMGFTPMMPAAVKAGLDKAGVAAAEVTHFCLPTTLPKGADGIARKVGIPAEAVRDNLQAVCGDSGAAHSMVMLAHALEESKPGDKIVVATFGQGADVLVFEVTEAIAKVRPTRGVSGYLARRKEETNYTKFLAFRDLLDFDRGLRAEADKQSPLSMMWRHRKATGAMIGGKCTKCDTPQYPASRICVNPDCRALDSQDPYSFAEKVGTVNSYTADLLAYSPEPPNCYGMLVFPEGGRCMIDFIDVAPDDLHVGQEMRLVYRIKEIDDQRGFRRYFWKATPVADTAKDS